MFGAPLDGVPRSAQAAAQRRQARSLVVGFAQQCVLFGQPCPSPSPGISGRTDLRSEAGLRAARKAFAGKLLDRFKVGNAGIEQFECPAELGLAPIRRMVGVSQSQLGRAGSRAADRPSDNCRDACDIDCIGVPLAKLGILPFCPFRRLLFGQFEQLCASVDGAAAPAQIAGDRRRCVGSVTPGKLCIVDFGPFADGIAPQSEVVDLGADRFEPATESIGNRLERVVRPKCRDEMV